MGCPFKSGCLGKLTQKRFSVIYHKSEYERAIARVNSRKGKHYKKRRHATVEPVFGVLTQYLGLRKVNTKGIHNANKQFMMAAIAYNLKKYLKFEHKRVQSGVREAFQALKTIIYWLTGPIKA